MAQLTFEDWVQWGVCCAVAKCDDAVRPRFEKFIARSAAENIWKLPEWERSRLGDFLEDNAEGRRRCATAFDTYMLHGRKKILLLGCTPQNPNPTQDDYAAAWSAYAHMCIRSMVREVLRKEVKPPPGPSPVEFDKEIGEGDTTTRLDVTAAGGATVEDLISLREVERLGATIELNERESLILWADQHSEDRCGAKMQTLAQCGRSQLSLCAKQLERRLRGEITGLFQLEPHEEDLGVAWTAWAWQTLALRFQNIFPERDADGALKWRKDKQTQPTIPHASTL